MANFSPQGARSFVAYTTPADRIASEDGLGITIGVQTHVSTYEQVLVSSITKSGTEDFPIYHVEFDPDSIGMKHRIGASISAEETQILSVLKDALDTKTPVNVALENSRRPKHKDTGDTISPVTPILSLMGADSPSGKANANDTMNTTRKVVAAVNDIVSSECRSNPKWWVSLSQTKDGSVPPEGMRLITDEEWTRAYIVYVDKLENTSTPTPVHTTHTTRGVPNGGRTAPGAISEGKVYDELTANGEISLGSYANTAWRAVFMWAFDHLGDEDIEKAIALTYDVLMFSERVQARAYGVDHPQPGAPSLKEASHWARWLIEHGYLLDEDGEALAVFLMHKAGEYAHHVYMADRAPQKPPVNPELTKFISYLNQNWGDVTMIRRAYIAAKDKGFADVPVTVNSNGVTLKEGGMPLISALEARGRQLVSREPSREDSAAQGVADQLSRVHNAEEALALWDANSALVNETVTFEGEEVALSEAFARTSNRLTPEEEPSAQDLAEQAVLAETLAQLKAIQGKVNAHKLADSEVNDGTSDEPVLLRDLMKRRRAELK